MRRAHSRLALIGLGGLGLAVIAGGVLMRPAPTPVSGSAAAPAPVHAPAASVAADVPTDGRVLASANQPLSLPGTAIAIRSMLAVPSRMTFGQSVWNDKGVPDGPLWIRVDREAQLISVFRGPHEIGTAVILYGAPLHPTPAGRYPILAKMKDHRSSIYDADMPYTMRLTDDGVAIHASNVLEGRATHGCVGVPEDFAKRLFDMTKKGDPVFIV